MGSFTAVNGPFNGLKEAFYQHLENQLLPKGCFVILKSKKQGFLFACLLPVFSSFNDGRDDVFYSVECNNHHALPHGCNDHHS